jgi:hypothetical protein
MCVPSHGDGIFGASGRHPNVAQMNSLTPFCTTLLLVSLLWLCHRQGGCGARHAHAQRLRLRQPHPARGLGRATRRAHLGGGSHVACGLDGRGSSAHLGSMFHVPKPVPATSSFGFAPGGCQLPPVRPHAQRNEWRDRRGSVWSQLASWLVVPQQQLQAACTAEMLRGWWWSGSGCCWVVPGAAAA